MLTRVHFKNWRSLHDVVLDDLGLITVLIGANSSGKTNIVEGFEFLRRIVTARTAEAAWYKAQRDFVRTLGSSSHEDLEFEVETKPDVNSESVVYRLRLDEQEPIFWESVFKAGTKIAEDYNLARVREPSLFVNRPETLMLPIWAQTGGNISGGNQDELHDLWTFIADRWQILDVSRIEPFHRFAPESNDVFLLEKDAQNLPSLLEFMADRYKEASQEFRADVRWLLNHVDSVDPERFDRQLRVAVTERYKLWESAPPYVPPTMSLGTARIVALLAAYHALDMRAPQEPGLIIVDEPDASLNPGILGKLVELLRSYTSREGRPRQFILTTHNPAFLNYFTPDEVRIVSRDAQGHTHVERVPESVRKIWLEDGTYALGEVWDMGAFGVPAE
ncbi:MAG: ATP-binding protein [Anaerolineae bacterium]|nr:ATP-binding protein [Anaerolineae bacterium]NUQ03973.1 ATP-binding protein [Anaerolineae bacterium]